MPAAFSLVRYLPPVSFRHMRAARNAMVFAAAMLAAVGALMSASSTTPASGSQPAVRAISMTTPHAYKPVAAAGTTDDYHCTLVNPHVVQNEYIISSQFVAGSDEVHHAALFLLSPSAAAAAERANKGERMDVLRSAPPEL